METVNVQHGLLEAFAIEVFKSRISTIIIVVSIVDKDDCSSIIFSYGLKVRLFTGSIEINSLRMIGKFQPPQISEGIDCINTRSRYMKNSTTVEEEAIAAGSAIYQVIEEDPRISKNDLKDIIIIMVLLNLEKQYVSWN